MAEYGFTLKDLAMIIATAGAVYGGIRMELRLMHERVNRLENKVFK